MVVHRTGTDATERVPPGLSGVEGGASRRRYENDPAAAIVPNEESRNGTAPFLLSGFPHSSPEVDLQKWFRYTDAKDAKENYFEVWRAARRAAVMKIVLPREHGRWLISDGRFVIAHVL